MNRQEWEAFAAEHGNVAAGFVIQHGGYNPDAPQAQQPAEQPETDPPAGYPPEWDSPAVKAMRESRQQAAQRQADAEQSAQALQRAELAHPGGSPTQPSNVDSCPSNWLPIQGVSR